MPTFNGGDPSVEFKKYISANLIYPEEALEKGIQGTVIVQFTIDSTGNVVNELVINSVNPLLEKEALRIIRSSPKWSPGKLGNKTVPVPYTIPVEFTILKRK